MTLIFPLLIALSAAPAPDDATESARAHFSEGVTQYKLARFDTALASFESAYEAKPLPGFLFNIAQCHFQLAHYDKAIFFYEGYLHGRPDAPNRQAVSERIEEAKRMLASRQAAAPPSSAAADDSGRNEETLDAVRRAEDVARRLEKKLEAADERPPAETTSSPPYLLWGAVGATGAAAAAATTAAVVGGGLVLFVVATQPDLMQPSGSLGTLDRSPHSP